jgi:hypothetical protein
VSKLGHGGISVTDQKLVLSNGLSVDLLSDFNIEDWQTTSRTSTAVKRSSYRQIKTKRSTSSPLTWNRNLRNREKTRTTLKSFGADGLNASEKGLCEAAETRKLEHR